MKKKDEKEKWIDKWDSEIMWWFYDILENELEITMIHDSSELRAMLNKAYKRAKKITIKQVIQHLESKRVPIDHKKMGRDLELMCKYQNALLFDLINELKKK